MTIKNLPVRKIWHYDQWLLKSIN